MNKKNHVIFLHFFNLKKLLKKMYRKISDLCIFDVVKRVIQQFLRVPGKLIVRRLCSHFRNCRAQKTHEIDADVIGATHRRGDKTRNGVLPAVRPHRETTVLIERTESRFGRDGAAGQL